MINLADYTSLAQLDADIRILSDERNRLSILEQAAKQAETIAKAYEEAVAQEAPTTEMPHGGWGPGVKYKDADGIIYRNKSGAWLSAGPKEYPLGWSQESGLPDPSETAAWSPGVSVKAGELYSYQGKIYRVIQSHTTQSGWEPPSVPALWSEQG